MKKKDYCNYFILGGTVLLIFLIVTHFSNVFGSDTDWINQHTVIPDYFRQLFYQTGNLFPNFAFSYGAGQNIFNLSYYGLFSPIILISYFLPFMGMKTYIIISNLIIIILSSILFYRWLRNNNYNENIALISALIFVLSDSFIFHMHRHVMFVNYMPFLIMGLMGVDKLFKSNKKSLLIIGIFLMIMTSYYYSVGGILVIGIYYLYKYFSDKDKKGIKLFLKDLIKFIGLVFIGVLMASLLLLPTVYTLLNGRGTSETSINLLSLFVPYLKIHKIFCGTYAIGLSMLAFIALLYLFFTKKKNNIILGILLCVVLLIPIFMYILNGGLYLREKCFIPFMPLFGMFIAYFLNDLFNGKIKINKFIIFVSVVAVILYYFNQKQYCYLYLIGFIIMLIIFNKYKCKKILAIYLVLCSFGMATVANLKEDYVSIDLYNEIFDKDVEDSINNVILNDNSYFRSNNLMYPTKTVNKMYNEKYFTTNIYSSTYNYNYLTFVRDVFQNSRLEYNYFMVPASNNILFNTFMGVKYLNSSYDPGLGYELVSDNVYVNNDVFPIFYATSNVLSEEEFNKYSYPYSLEILLNNVIVSKGSGKSDTDTYAEKVSLDYEVVQNEGVEILKENNGYVFNVKEKGNITIKLKEKLVGKILFINLEGLEENSCSYDNISMKINNVENILTCKSWIYPNKNNTFRYVISDDAIDELKIELSKGTYNISNIEVYTLDYSKITGIKDSFDEFNITNFEEDNIEGNINVKEDAYFVTSIPYDEGFTIKVDGKVIGYEKVNKAFVGFPITKGEHTIVISYKAPWFKEGLVLSAISFVVFIVIVIFDLRKKKKY